MEEILKVKGVEVGEVYPTNTCGYLVVDRPYRKGVKRLMYADTSFIDTGTKKAVLVGNLRKGEVKDTYCLSSYNVGYLGSATRKGNERVYDIWNSMLERCYNINSERYSYYGGVGATVCEEWHDFSVFLEYYSRNYIEGFQLDKDLLTNGEDKKYSPASCCFLPASVNRLLGSISRGDGVLQNSKQWDYGGGGGNTIYPQKLFPTKAEAYKYRAECFKDRLNRFVERYSNVLSVKVVSEVTKVLQKEIDKTGSI